MEFINEKLQEFNNFLNGRKVAIIGLGVSNIPLIEYMHKYNANVTVFDEKEMEEIPADILNKIRTYSMSFSFGKNNLERLKGFDIIFRSPSCLPTRPELEQEEKRGALVTTEI